VSTGVIVIVAIVAVLALGLVAWIAGPGRDRGEREREALRDDLGPRSHAERARSHR
jgi:hypothetical protein